MGSPLPRLSKDPFSKLQRRRLDIVFSRNDQLIGRDLSRSRRQMDYLEDRSDITNFLHVS